MFDPKISNATALASILLWQRSMGKLRYHIALIVANILFGVAFPVYVSLLKGAMQPAQLFSLQLIFSALIFTLPAIFHRNFFRLTLNDFGSIFIVALLVVFGWWYLLIEGAAHTNPIDASTITTIGPIFTLITSIIVHSRPAKWGEKIGITLAISGVAVMLYDRGRQLIGYSGEGYGNALVLCAVVAIAVNTVLIMPVLRRHGPIVVMGWYYIIGATIALPLLIREVSNITTLQLSTKDWFEIGYILILGSALAMYLLYSGAEHLTATHNAIYRYIQPIVATIIAVTRGLSVIDRTNIVGAALIFVGMLCVIISTPREVPTRE